MAVLDGVLCEIYSDDARTRAHQRLQHAQKELADASRKAERCETLLNALEFERPRWPRDRQSFLERVRVDQYAERAKAYQNVEQLRLQVLRLEQWLTDYLSMRNGGAST